MTDQNKAMTALVRSMKKALQDQHGIKVPHAALRASYLQAQGEHPHAFVGKKATNNNEAALRELVDKAPAFFHPEYDFDGEKLAWLEKAGLKYTTKPSASNTEEPATSARHRLYLAEDDIDCLERISLDPDGEVLLPKSWEFKKAVLESLAADIPRVSKYGLPDYLGHR